MSKPAARLGDMTIHGGSIVAGNPTVLIAGQPAARVSDMHVCPLANPGTPPPPHVGGPVSMGSPTVLIGGMPAARMGDMLVCAGPPDTVAMGAPNVLIGEAGTGAATGGGAGMSGAAAAQASASAAVFDNNEVTTKEEHWIEFQFVDKAGLPVSGVPYTFEDPEGKVDEGKLRMDGKVRRDGLDEGQCRVVLKSVYEAKWETEKARPEEKVAYSAKMHGFEDGTIATVQIIKRDITGPDVVVDEIEAKVQGGKIEGEWTFIYPDDKTDEEKNTPAGYTSPQFYFEVIVNGCRTRSGLLEYQDYLEIELHDENGDPIPGENYILYLSNGEVRKGKLDDGGYAKEENLPPVSSDIRFPNLPSSEEHELASN